MRAKLIVSNSLALSVKMSILLYIPGILILQVLKRGLIPGVSFVFFTVIGTQVLLASPFIQTPENAQAYMNGAFEFSRVFLYKWTVNWRFIPEDSFLSKEFAFTLLIGHISSLLIFAAFRWSKLAGGFMRVVKSAVGHPFRPLSTIAPTPDGMILLLQRYDPH